MEEQYLTGLRAIITEVARKEIRQIIIEELPEILDIMNKPGSGLSDYVDYNSAASMLNVTKATLHTYIKTGKLCKYTIVKGGKPYLKKSEIEKLMKGGRKINPALN